MFGSEYSKHPEILIDSFREMKDEYKKKARKKQNSIILLFLQKIYISIFGIPEIGFQVRSAYFKNAIFKNLRKKKLKKILDAGSGIGVYVFYMAKFYPLAKVDGWEIDKNKLFFCQKFAKQLGIENADFKFLDITKKNKIFEKFDLIINIDVLEHIENYKKVLKNFYELLTPRGYLYIHTPQPDQKRIFKQLKKWQHEDHVHEGFTPGELKRETERLGFKIIEMKETFGFFGKLSWELNHISFEKSFLIVGLLYPFLYLIGKMDILVDNKDGLGTAILAKKLNN